MKQQVWSSPKTVFEQFVPQVYCKNCSADDNKTWVYNFTCNAGTKGEWHSVYLETNGQAGLQTGWDGDKYQSYSYGPCGATHTVETTEKLSDANLNTIFPKGYIKINGEWKDCRVWTANNTNTHCTTALDIDDFQLAKS